MTINRQYQPGNSTGIYASDIFPYTVALGSLAGTIGNIVNLGRAYAGVVISCDDCSVIPSRTIGLKVAQTVDAGTLNDLWKADGSAIWASGTLPTSGGFHLYVIDAFFVAQVQPIFSGSVTGTVTLNISGYEPGIG